MRQEPAPEEVAVGRLAEAGRMVMDAGRRLGFGALMVVLVLGLGRAMADMTSTWTVLSPQSEGVPAVLSSDLEVFRRVLGLGEDEYAALCALHEAYVRRLEAEGREVRRFCTEIVEEAQIKRDKSLLEPAQERVRAWRERREELEERFLEDVRVLLSAEQEGRWRLVEREMRRLKRVGFGRLHGESVDLIRLAAVVGIEPEESERVAEILERYSRELDRALVRRDRRIAEGEAEGFYEMMERDRARARAIYERCLEARESVRDINRRYLRLLASEVGGARGALLERRFFERSFRDLSRATVAERYAEAALALPGLSEGQREELEGLREAYEADRDAILREQAEIQMARELELPARLAKDGVGPAREVQPGVPLPEDDPLQKLRVKRWHLDRSFRDRVESVLSDAQRASLPSFAETATFRAGGGWVSL